jgi:hypothetical protein
MNLTNKYGYRRSIVRAIEKDPYTKGASDFSVTELLQPSRQWALKKQYQEKLTEDVDDRLWALFGTGVHRVLEEGADPRDLVEKRFFMKLANHTISGQIDLLEHDTLDLCDFKTSSVWAFMAGREAKDEWTAQLNMQLELLRFNGLDAKKLFIIGVLRDHMESKASSDKKYPQMKIVEREIEMWPREKTIDFILSRIESHAKALKELPRCKASEAWAGRRCARYCIVNTYCDQYQGSKKTGLLEGETTT